jgi:hypothetical protein
MRTGSSLRQTGPESYLELNISITFKNYAHYENKMRDKIACIRVFMMYMPYLRVYKPQFFDKNLPSKIGVRLIHGI